MPYNLKIKKQSKEELLKKMSFKASGKKKALLGIFLDHDLNKQEVSLLKDFLEGAKVLNVDVVILDDNHLEEFPVKDHKVLEYSRENRSLLLEAADIALAFAFNDVEEMLLHGTIPLSFNRKELDDYDPNSESGNSFIFDKINPWSAFSSLVRALETFRFPYDWKHIVQSGAKSVGGENAEERQKIEMEMEAEEEEE